MNKNELRDKLRVIQLEILQNDWNLNGFLDNTNDKRMCLGAINRWKKKRKEIAKEIDKIEKLAKAMVIENENPKPYEISYYEADKN